MNLQSHCEPEAASCARSEYVQRKTSAAATEPYISHSASVAVRFATPAE